MNVQKTLITIIFGISLASNVIAAPISYPNSGSVNTQTYSFTAANSGDVIAYFAGSTAGYDETVSLLVNGIDTGITGLQNHSSAYGQAFNFGHVNAGSNLVFKLNVTTTGDTFYSDQWRNIDGGNHVYSSAYAGDNLIPAGIYVAFEDLLFPNTDYNYHDDTFVFTNVAANISTVPVPAAVWLFSSALTSLIGLRKRKQQANV